MNMLTTSGDIMFRINMHKDFFDKERAIKIVDKVLTIFEEENLSPDEGNALILRILVLSAANQTSDVGDTGYSNLLIDIFTCLLAMSPKAIKLIRGDDS